jgi:bifunctional UDP-N-acetylglucosamine pyrophosphorylase / glucosamine-1-phosphate N-acetyltransferase
VGDLSGTVVVSYGDMPLLRGETLQRLVDEHHAARNAVTVLTARGDAAGYGRIVRDEGGGLLRIVEERDATPDERAIDEYNSGCYAFDGTLLADVIKRVTTDNAQGQEYLTDVVGTRSARWSPPTRARSRGSTTGCSWRRCAGRSTTGCCESGCGPG